MEDEIITNAATTSCCGESVENCTCGGGYEPEPAAVLNREYPVGGGLGQPEWDFRGNGVINFSRSAVAEPTPVVQNATPGQPNYALAGAGQFAGAPKQVTNAKVDDSKPVGGPLGQSTWNF